MKNTEELENPKCRSEVREGEDLQLQIYCGGSPPFSGRFRLMQRPRSTKMRCSATATAAELEQHRSRERKKMTERGRMKKDLKAVRIYKGRLISGREKRGGQKLWVSSLSGRLDSLDGY